MSYPQISEIRFVMRFYQHFAEGSFDKKFVDSGFIVSQFEKAVSDVSKDEEAYCLGNLVSMFCTNDFQEKEVAIKTLLGAYFKKHPIEGSNLFFEIDLSRLLADYDIDDDHIIEAFDLDVFREHEVMQFDLNEVDKLPIELRRIIKAIQESKDKSGIILYDQKTDNFDVLDEEKHDEIYGKGSHKVTKELSTQLLEQHILATKLNAFPASKTKH